jgi:putative pyruvate formate lyase activating enzyme
LNDRLTHCDLCPRRCGANRRAGEAGACGAGERVEVYRWGPHFGEEPPLVGKHGSGTVFFGRCTLRCIYCQNFPWSQQGAGKPYEVGELADMFGALRKAGCANWNLVSPTPWLPHIREALREARREGPALPVVSNTSSYERVETLAAFAGMVDVFLADLRYAREASGLEGSGVRDYVDVARQAIVEMWRQVGALQVDAQGLARKGLICRVLILPGRAEEAAESLQWLAECVGTDVAVSVMAQYVPAHRAAEGPAPWNRRISRREYDSVCEAMEALGFARGWVQEFEDTADAALVGYDMKPGEGAAGAATMEKKTQRAARQEAREADIA